MTKAYEDFRHEVLSNPETYPELHRIETAKNKLRFKEA